MAQVKQGDTVKIHYTGTLTDGTEFDSSVDRDPIEFKVGDGRLIPGFERGVIGMVTGDKKSITVSVDEAYGPRRDELVVVVERNQMPPDLDPKVGDNLVLEQNEKQIRVRVTEMTAEEITLDANHPLAGEELNFEIELVEIV
jgi:peptidylprolyl isomerase